VSPCVDRNSIMRLEVSLSEVVTVAMVIYVLSPVDCMSESEMGARGLIDDLIVIWLLAMGFAAWFSLVVVLFATSASTALPCVHNNILGSASQTRVNKHQDI